MRPLESVFWTVDSLRSGNRHPHAVSALGCGAFSRASLDSSLAQFAICRKSRPADLQPRIGVRTHIVNAKNTRCCAKPLGRSHFADEPFWRQSRFSKIGRQDVSANTAAAEAVRSPAPKTVRQTDGIFAPWRPLFIHGCGKRASIDLAKCYFDTFISFLKLTQ